MGKIVLIDGFSIINRAYYGVPLLSNSAGLHTNGIYGFLNIILKVLDEEKPDYVTVAFDVKAPTFRHLMYKEYKGTRKGMPEELLEQVPVLKEVLHAMNILTVEKAGFEADDILGTIARKAEAEGIETILISGDRDLLQIATDKTAIWIPKTKKGGTEIEKYNTQDVVNLYGVTPTEFIDMKALMGDSSDNIPGVPSIGEKTAGSLIKQFHSIANLKEHLDEVTPKRAQNALKEHFDMAELSRTLAEIKTDCDIDFTFEEAAMGALYNPASYEWMKKLEIKSLAKKFASQETIEKQMEASADSFSQIMISDETDLTAMKKAFAEADKLSFALFHEEPDVCTQENILYAAALAKGQLYICDNLMFMPAFIAAIVEAPCKKVTLNLKLQLKALHTYAPAGAVRDASKDNVSKDDISKDDVSKDDISKDDVSKDDISIEDASIDDVSLMAYLLNPIKDSYEYDDLAGEFLDKTFASKKELLGKDNLKKSVTAHPDELRKMAEFACQTALLAAPILMEKLEAEGMKDLYTNVELPLTHTLYSMSDFGIRVDRDALKEYGDKLAIMVNELESSIYDLAGEEFNINSPKQLGVILFEKLNLPCSKKTKTGYSTAADVLEKLRPDYPIVDKILNYRTVSKLKSTYADGLAVYIKEDGRIHGNFQQTITATGRISSTDPNLQNIPARMELGRQIRKVFIPKDGYKFVDADYSQIELRVLAHMSEDDRLITAYNQAEDIHAITASQVFGVPLAEVTPLQRRNAKAVNFGIVYGISAFGLSEDLSITRKEAQEYMEKYFATYPSIKAFLNGLVDAAKESGVTRTMFGRIRPVPELKSGNFMQRSFGERIAMNAPIQGTAADIIKIAMIRVDRRLKAECKYSRLLLQIHDELLIEAHEEEVEQVKTILKEEMSGAAKLSVRLETSMEVGDNWYETK